MTALHHGLPENAKLVFKGVRFEVWQWEQTMYDGSIAIFEKVWRMPTVNVIAVTDGKIIIEDQDQPGREDKITIPSGVSENDDLLEEAKRELLDETGFKSDDWELFHEEIKDGKVLWDSHYYVARKCLKIQEQQLDSGEKISVRLISFEDFLDLVDNPKFHIASEFAVFLLRIRADEAKKAAFKKMLLG
jgi:ADP-ribose pyrophosphatase